MQIISGSSNKTLAQKISKITGYKLLSTVISNFSDGELKIQIKGDIGKDVIIIQSTSNPVNEHLIELLLLIDTAKRAGAINIVLVIPYFGYSRHDHCSYKHGPVAAKLVAKILETSGVTKIITLDLHSKQLEGFFDIPIINLDSFNIFFPVYKDSNDIVVVSPDLGGIYRARNFSSLFGKDLIILNKTRNANGGSFTTQIAGDVKNKKCIIIDDIIDTGCTICNGAEFLKKNGALEIHAYVTHGVLSKGSIEKINNSPISKIFISNSIEHKSLPDKFFIRDIDELISYVL